jgi:disulfide bond formation protein DsbB
MLFRITPLRGAALVLVISFATIAGAWILEAWGVKPCALCLQQRWAYYIGVPVAAAAVLIAWRGPQALAKSLLVLLAIIFAGSAVFGAYHAGVEWGLWPGPSSCTGALPQMAPAPGKPFNMQDMLKGAQVVPCDKAVFWIFGISLAGWNAILSAVMVIASIWSIKSK